MQFHCSFMNLTQFHECICLVKKCGKVDFTTYNLDSKNYRRFYFNARVMGSLSLWKSGESIYFIFVWYSRRSCLFLELNDVSLSWLEFRIPSIFIALDDHPGNKSAILTNNFPIFYVVQQWNDHSNVQMVYDLLLVECHNTFFLCFILRF
jgi:hypothetical protein